MFYKQHKKTNWIFGEGNRYQQWLLEIPQQQKNKTPKPETWLLTDCS